MIRTWQTCWISSSEKDRDGRIAKLVIRLPFDIIAFDLFCYFRRIWHYCFCLFCGFCAMWCYCCCCLFCYFRVVWHYLLLVIMSIMFKLNISLSLLVIRYSFWVILPLLACRRIYVVMVCLKHQKCRSCILSITRLFSIKCNFGYQLCPICKLFLILAPKGLGLKK